jgi:dTDP-glucose pyrophosphorylase
MIPMAGLGSRFKEEGFDVPKPLIQVCGKTLVQHSVDSLGIKENVHFCFVTRKFEKARHNKTLSLVLKNIVENLKLVSKDPSSVSWNEVLLGETTSGAADTCLKAFERSVFKGSEKLIITNCDQNLEWNYSDFLSSIENYCTTGEESSEGIGAAVLTYDSLHLKNSFAITEGHDDSRIEKVVEKPDSLPKNGKALVGVHWWREARYFCESASKMLAQNLTGEHYISTTFNYLPKVKIIIPLKGKYHSLGTPYDLAVFEAKTNEYKNNVSKTVFCDLDGTVFKHSHSYSEMLTKGAEVLPGVLAKLNQWDSLGYKIILVSARKESARNITEDTLESFGIPYDHLILGVNTGPRVLINDRLSEEDEARAIAFNVITDKGLQDITI